MKINMNINFEEVIQNLGYRANKIYNDSPRLKQLLKTAKEKAEGNKQLNTILSDIKLLVELMKDWKDGHYTDLSKNTAIMVIISLVYLVSPIDIIPDFLMGGFVDDAAVIAYVIKNISGELNQYKEWKKLKEDIIEEIIIEE